MSDLTVKQRLAQFQEGGNSKPKTASAALAKLMAGEKITTDTKPKKASEALARLKADTKTTTDTKPKTQTKPVSQPSYMAETVFDENKAGLGDGSIPLDITPWYGDKMKTNYTKEQWADFVKSTGFKPTVANTVSDPKAQVREFQHYLSKQDGWKDEIANLHSNSKGFGTPTKSGKKFDGYLGRRWDVILEKKFPKKEPESDLKITPAATDPGTEPGPIATNPLQTRIPNKTRAPWWLQDKIKIAGAAFDLANIKRYQPWQANPDVRLPEATFYDPTRELAANSEQANMAYQAQTAFSNPQQLAAASAVTQGLAAKNAADIMGRYNNLNVGVANQLSQEQTGILNVAAQNKAANDTQLWDKYTTLNQNFDNSKAMARQNLRQSFIDGVTNSANTANLNEVYPQFAVNPSNGGKMYFKGATGDIPANRPFDAQDAAWKKAQTMSSDPTIQLQLWKTMVGKGDSQEATV